MDDLNQFFTRQIANEGIELPLSLPDGTATEHKIRIRGFDSDAFQAENNRQKRKLFEAAASKDKSAIAALNAQEGRIELLSSLVISWTFKTECTPANVQKLLREAPQIADAIDRLAADRSIFFVKRSDSSTSSPEQSSS